MIYQSNFDDVLKKVLDGEGVFFVPRLQGPLIIDAGAAGEIKKDASGWGYNFRKKHLDPSHLCFARRST